jgi:SNF2 domain-containing protein/SNF2 helicase protein
MSRSLIPVLTPHGSLRLDQAEAEFSPEDGLAERLEKCFTRGSGHCLLQLGAREAGTSLPSSLAWWREFALRFVAIDKAPPMQGGEYLQLNVLIALWQATERAGNRTLREQTPSPGFLESAQQPLASRWTSAFQSRRKSPGPGLSFRLHGDLYIWPLGRWRLATPATRPAAMGICSAGDKAKLLQLLAPVQQASEACAWLKNIVDAGEIFHPLRWTPQDAVRFVQDVEAMERAGLVIRMPANWRMNRPSRPSVEATVGSASPSVLGMDALLDFRVQVSLDGEILTIGEINKLLASTHGLALLRGKWVEVDPTRLRATLDKFQAIERLSEKEGVPFGQAMRLLARAEIGAAASGVRWLYLLTQLGLGACLADDMGLGKTIQVLALLLVLGQRTKGAAKTTPSLLVTPASLLANWALEAARFTRGLKILVAHPSFLLADALRSMNANRLAATDLVVTSYATLLRLGWIGETQWHLVVLDEAQVVKNPNTKQTKAVKWLSAKGRIVLIGTPIENNLRDLWSIFDFVNPGLLGSPKAFANFVKALASQPHVSYAPLRRLVQPYTCAASRATRASLPICRTKTEIKAFRHLTRKQAALYQAAVAELGERLKQSPYAMAGQRQL